MQMGSRSEQATAPAEADSRPAEANRASLIRSEIAERDEAAAARDETARLRDEAADAQDRLAEESERAISVEVADGPIEQKLDAALRALDASRAEAAKARRLARADRQRAASDRDQAAADRARSAAELRRAHLDDLTGAYRRQMGELALLHEVERAHRSQRPLILAYVDIDGLKNLNDARGHAAGDELLRNVADAIRSKLRPYDPLVRMGGDEFVCAFPSPDLGTAQDRFAQIKEVLSESDGDASISVGFAELRAEETLEGLIARADEALYERKRAGWRRRPKPASRLGSSI
jgi:diguanylate cyclase (GGDEF)-like protein